MKKKGANHRFAPFSFNLFFRMLNDYTTEKRIPKHNVELPKECKPPITFS
mgnify:CR=1 FL=1